VTVKDDHRNGPDGLSYVVNKGGRDAGIRYELSP
jgi:hypothetical protein